MTAISFIHNVGSDGNGLFVTSLPTETIVHRFDTATDSISIPAFSGLSGTADNVEFLRKAVFAYYQWLQDIASSPANAGLSQVAPTPKRSERHITENGTVESRYTVQLSGSPVRLLRMSWDPESKAYELRAHPGGVTPYAAVLEWNLATTRFVDNVLHWK